MQRIKLGEVLDIKRGPSLSSRYFSKTGDKIRLTLGNFNYPNGGFKHNVCKDDIYYVGTVSPQYILKEGDIITPLTEQVRGLLGSTATIPESNKYIQNGDVALVIPNENLINKRFSYYLISSAIVKSQLDAGSQQTKIRHTSPDDIKNCIAYIPSEIKIQEKIANLLDMINLKISYNTEINTQLEELAKTIYDYWFLQFEFPNEEDKPYKSSGGKMVYNEQLKREIPEGWKTRTLNSSNLFTIIKQGVDYFSKKNYLATANVIDNNILDGNLISYENREGRANMQPRLNSVWFAKMKNSRKHIFISQSDQWMVDKYIISTGFTGLQCNTITFPYVYSYINSDYFEKVKDYRASGSTQEGIGDDDLILFSIVEPIEQTLVSYSKLVGCLIEKMNILRLENQYLSSLRDFLLPILMNGQVTFKGENEGLESENNKSATISYIERFNQWKQMQGYAARGDVDDEILMKIFDAMDEDDKK